MQIDFFAREKHHITHAQAIADGFGVKVKTRLSEIIADYVVVFSYGDLKLIDSLGNKGIIFAEHGVGMFYNNSHPSYAGSVTGRDRVILRLSPNETHASKERETLECPVEVIGVPKLDKFAGQYWNFNKEKPTIAVSFHFDCFVCPETRSSFKYFQNAVVELSKTYNVIGHAHPRLMLEIESFYRKNHIQVVKNFEDVLKLADCYCIDNSSTIFEWCITEKPIVLLNPPFYRKDVEQKGNPRFWRNANIAPHCDTPLELLSCIKEAVENHDKYIPFIRQAQKDVLTFTDGKCAERAVEAIKKHIQ